MAADSWRLDIERLDDVGERHDRKFVVALARGLEVLRAFTPSEGLLGNQEIAARTGLAKATVSRLTYTLTTLGYLAHIDRLEKYQLAPGALAIGYSTLANMRIRQVAKPHMQALANYTGASVALGTRDRLNAIYIEFCRGKSATMLRLDVGARIPLATTAMGRALLAGTPVKDQQRLLRQIARREGGKWSKMRARASSGRCATSTAADFASRSANGNPTSTRSAFRSRPPDGSGIFAFNCGAPAFHFSRSQLENEIGPRLLNTMRNIEAELRGP